MEIEVPTELAAMIGDFLPRSPPHDPTDARPILRDACTYCGHAPHPDAERDRLAAAWDEGHQAGHEDARAVQSPYPEPTPNPYRTEGDPR